MSKKRILLVDDEGGFTRMAKLTLESTGEYVVFEENHARSAYETALKVRPDFIFLDVVMPDADGGEVAARIKRDRSLADVPIVFLTAIVSASESTGSDEIGGYPFLAKPVSLDAMKACIESHLEQP